MLGLLICLPPAVPDAVGTDDGRPERSHRHHTTRWSASELVEFMDAHPQRAYFAHAIRDGGFGVAMEVGVADGRFSEFMLETARPRVWSMVEPFPNVALASRCGSACGLTPPPQGTVSAAASVEAGRRRRGGIARRGAPGQPDVAASTWSQRGIGANSTLKFFKALSLHQAFLDAVPDASLDFAYLDGAHDYTNVKKELFVFWPKIRPGGILAGHDYCNYGERGLGCVGCEDVPHCPPYTDYGIRHGKPPGKASANQAEVVRAVHEWLVEAQPSLRLHHTIENFTEASLAADGIKYESVVTTNKNPSWYVIKPRVTRGGLRRRGTNQADTAR